MTAAPGFLSAASQFTNLQEKSKQGTAAMTMDGLKGKGPTEAAYAKCVEVFTSALLSVQTI